MAIGLVVAVGTLLGESRWLGTMGTWVPISGLFVLVLGEADPAHFVLGYLGLTTLGALIGAATNLLVPPLHLARTRQAQDALRAALADQLDTLADLLGVEGLPTAEDWAARRPSMRARSAEMEELLGAGDRRSTGELARPEGQERGAVAARARAGAGVAGVAGGRAHRRPGLAPAARSRGPRAPGGRPAGRRGTLRATAEALRSTDEHEADVEAAWSSLARLAADVRRCRDRSAEDLFAAGALVTSIERTLTTMGPTAAA